MLRKRESAFLKRDTPLRLLGRVVAVLAVIIVGPPVACETYYKATHPAPLGRSRDSMLHHLDALVPRGTSIDTAIARLTATGLPVWKDSVRVDQQAMFPDSLLAGGYILHVSQERVAGGFLGMTSSGFMTLYFDRAGRLVNRMAVLSADNPF